MRDILVVHLAQILVSLFGFFLEQLHAPLQRLVLGALLYAVVGERLGLLERGFQLLHLFRQQLHLVGERRDLLLLGQVLLLELLVLALQLLDLALGFLVLEAERIQSLKNYFGGGKERGNVIFFSCLRDTAIIIEGIHPFFLTRVARVEDERGD